MDYAYLGKSGLKVSKLGLGASPLGGAYGNVNEGEATRIVHMAVDAGINYIDVSPYYGLTRAETLLGRALQTIPRNTYYLSTKVGRYGVSDFDFSAARVVASVDESLKRLNLDYVDVIFCHDIEFGSLDQIVNETIPALRRVQEVGKVRFIGISGLPLGIFRFVADRVDLDVVLSYCHYSLNDTALKNSFPYLKAKHLGIISASPLSMGLLTEAGPPDWHPASDTIQTRCAEAAHFCRSKGVNISQLALQFSVSQPQIDSTLVGIANPGQLEFNLNALRQPLDLELMSEVEAILRPIKDQSWLSGRLENNELQ